MDYVFKSKDNNYTIIICEATYAKIILECEKYINLETGGILIGNYSKDNSIAYIKDSINSPNNSKHYPHKFFRGTNGVNKILDKKWEEGVYYLGEWHYHPNTSSKSSKLDDIQMLKFSNNKKLNCPEPILIIIGGNPSKWSLNSYIYKNNEKIILEKGNMS